MPFRFFLAFVTFTSTIVGQNSSGGRMQAPADLTYITHVTVIGTGTGKESRDQTVLISGDRISEVKDSREVKPPPTGARIVDGTGKYLIPGLWDTGIG